ncbi:hypothetical protein [Lelliottia sp. WAP21]|uniref:hypothetical protein n=1 Tax=Lelliottia sp. WAP21 TaxID=2877426 RepID=UPI001E3062D1|nr:hypothetical protein [Lelliottia sp. WAP21]
MNDNEAAFKQQLDKLRYGGELNLECCGRVTRVVYFHDIYIVMVETHVSPDRLGDFLQQIQYELKANEQFILQNSRVHYCLFVKHIELRNIVSHASTALRCSMAYQ